MKYSTEVKLKLGETKPEYVPPPPLVPIGRPVLGWKAQKFERSASYKFLNTLLLFIFSVCMLSLGILIGCYIL